MPSITNVCGTRGRLQIAAIPNSPTVRASRSEKKTRGDKQQPENRCQQQQSFAKGEHPDPQDDTGDAVEYEELSEHSPGAVKDEKEMNAAGRNQDDRAEDAVNATGLIPSCIKAVWVPFKVSLATAVELGWLAFNPAQRVETVKSRRPESIFLSYPEVDRLVAAAFALKGELSDAMMVE